MAAGGNFWEANGDESKGDSLVQGTQESESEEQESKITSDIREYFCHVPKSCENPSASRNPDADCIKMFVGQIPQSFTEADLLQMFSLFGEVYDLVLLKDSATGRSKGCCFVTFFTRMASINAQNALHDIKVLPGMHHPVQMRPADTENRNERKLFVGMIPKEFTESDVRSLFSPYGTIEECVVLRDVNEKSKGCAFVTYLTRACAQDAIVSMHHSVKFTGCSSPMVVKFADTQKHKGLRRTLLQDIFSDQNALASFLQQLSVEVIYLVHQLQQRGYINVNNLLSNIEKTIPTQQVAVECFSASGADSGLATIAAPTVSDISTLKTLLTQLNDLSPETAHHYRSTISDLLDRGNRQHSTERQIEGPEGANLFVYHLPQQFKDEDLVQLFGQFGRVVSAKIFIDRATNMSKCFGFVSFKSVECAQSAIQSLNGFHIRGKRLKVEVKRKIK